MDLKKPNNRKQLKERSEEAGRILRRVEYLESILARVDDVRETEGVLFTANVAVSAAEDAEYNSLGNIEVDKETMKDVANVIGHFVTSKLAIAYEELYQALSEATIIR